MIKYLLSAILSFGLVLAGMAQESLPTEHWDLSYIDKQNQLDTLRQLNLVLPLEKDKVPLLVWIGGGAWSYVDRNVEMNFARSLAHEGIAVASVGHRLSTATWRDPEMNVGIKHPKHVEDIATALKWLYDHASDYNYDQDRIFIGGFSSGAHLAALVSLDKQYLAKYGLSIDVIKGIIPIGGTYDISDYHQVFVNGSRPELTDSHVKAVFGDTEEDFRKASVTSYLENLSAPILLMSDRNMTNYTRIFENAIRATDYQFLTVAYDTLSHVDLWRNLSFEKDSKHRIRIVNFIKEPTN